MNKYFIILAVAGIAIGAGVVWRMFLLPEEAKPFVSGVERKITVTTGVNQWRFFPEILEVNQGDKIIMTLVNEDSYDHGIGIDAFGISQRMPANSTITVEFVVTKAGDFPFYCSVPCGEGYTEGEKRTHFDMIGNMHVRSIISETQ